MDDSGVLAPSPVQPEQPWKMVAYICSWEGKEGDGKRKVGEGTKEKSWKDLNF